jgi:endonuclease/exonuclease/phosphatase family metal-dependent hydrolase
VLRVLTFNIQSCRAGIGAVAALLREADPDVATLNEVARGQEQALASALGRVAVKGTTRAVRGFGNAILLRERPRAVRRLRYSKTPARERRGLVAAELGSGLTVVATHLGLSGDERARHAAELLNTLDGVEPVVVAGDLNELPSSPNVRFLAARYLDAFAVAGRGGGGTVPVGRPEKRIDYILVSRDVRVRAAQVIPRIASDHLAVVAELDL